MRNMLLVTMVTLCGSSAFAAPPPPSPHVSVNQVVSTTGGGQVNANIKAGPLTIAQSQTVKGALLVGVAISVAGGFTTP